MYIHVTPIRQSSFFFSLSIIYIFLQIVFDFLPFYMSLFIKPYNTQTHVHSKCYRKKILDRLFDDNFISMKLYTSDTFINYIMYILLL